MEIIDDGLRTEVTAREANIAVRAHQDQGVILDAIEMMGIPIDIEQRAVRACLCVTSARDRVHLQRALVGLGEARRRLLPEGEQREVRAAKQLEETAFLPAFGQEVGRVGGAV